MYTKTQRSIPLSPLQRDVLIGTLLGDGSLSRSRNKQETACLRFSHSMKQHEYCSHKAGIFADLANRGVTTPSYPRQNGEMYQSARFITIYTTELFELYELFYPRGKKLVPTNIAELLSLVALAYWYMDDGSLSKSTLRRRTAGGFYEYHRSELAFHTNGFSKQNCEMLCKVLQEKFSLKLRLKRVDYGKHFILWTRSRIQIEHFVQLILPHMVPSMLYKTRVSYSRPMRNTQKYTATRIMRIYSRLRKKERKDILAYRNGRRLYHAIQWRFGSIKRLRTAILGVF